MTEKNFGKAKKNLKGKNLGKNGKIGEKIGKNIKKTEAWIQHLVRKRGKKKKRLVFPLNFQTFLGD